MLHQKLEHVLATTQGDVRAVERALMASLRAHGDRSPELQTQVLDALKALDALYFETQNSALFAADAKLNGGYPAMYTLPARQFWKSGLGKLMAYRQTLWAKAAAASQETHA